MTNLNYLRCSFLVRTLICGIHCWFLTSCNQPQNYDLVIQNGPIYTVDPQLPIATAVGISGGKIVYVGDRTGVQKHIGEETEILDLMGKTMTPGWIEGHGHFMGMGYSKLELDLRDAESYQHLVEMVETAVEQSQPGEWILGRGWHQSKWSILPDTMIKGFQTHQRLSAVSPDNPVYLRHASGHAGFANAKAMEIAGITNFGQEGAPTEVGEGGEIIKDPLGNPTGIFNEVAMNLITRHIPENSEATDHRALEMAISECLAFGITSFQDAGVDQNTIDLYREAIDKGRMPVRMWVMLSGSDHELLKNWFSSGPEIGYGNNLLTIRAIKMYMDGALGSQGAWLLEEYKDRPAHFGHLTTSLDSLESISRLALQQGFQVCSHAIGDRAIREVLNKYQKTFEQNPRSAKDPRFRIEHAQHINKLDLPRFADLGVIASMQAIHLSSDRPWAIDRLGIERIEEGAYVWQKLLQSGAVVINGSDVPVEPLDPLASFYASITRKTLDGYPEEGFEPSQRMTREQALRSYTLDAAFAAFEEDLKGSIEVGKLADFTVFDKDIMKVAEQELLDTKVMYTIIGGQVFNQIDSQTLF